jgi:hypothetical protein
VIISPSTPLDALHADFRATGTKSMPISGMICWAADDKAGLIHAVGRAVGAYAAYAAVDAPFKASAICAVVVLSYIYSLLFMKKVGG